MNNAEHILKCLDEKLDSKVELTLFGRAALQLGFKDALPDVALSRDVDAVLWAGQAEELNDKTNFWQAVEMVNDELADQELYISHFFTEDQIILRPEWRLHRAKLDITCSNLILYRLGNEDLLLSKLMRDDPLDQADARLIISHSNLDLGKITQVIQSARIPDMAEIREQFKIASSKLLGSMS